ncbi:type II secretion system protein E [Candidatus Magnetobacterium bavaricum]|uniref:Type II secretion system protein E n=1 Tax=Candidatus Magnetobacterium bavaricum TaxID=29290 RepID=A0A0F3GIA6_9BACT|nr:type II secretion system protein E [Candidatus Magnetobacterium bavaricum]
MVLKASEKLGDILVQSGLISPQQLKEALEEQKRTKKRLGIILCQKGWLKEEDIVKAFSNQLGVPYVDLSTSEPDHVALRIIPQSLAKRYLTLPLSFENNILSVVMADPLDDHLRGAIKFATGKEIKTNVATTTDIRKAIIRFYNGIKVEHIGDILIKAKVITKQQLAAALKKQDTDNRRLGEILVENKVATLVLISLPVANFMAPRRWSSRGSAMATFKMLFSKLSGRVRYLLARLCGIILSATWSGSKVFRST